MSTQVNQVIRQEKLDNALTPYLPFLSPRQKNSLMKIAWLDDYPNEKLAWSKLLGVSRFTIYRWLLDINFRNAMQLVVKFSTNTFYIPGIVNNLHKRALKKTRDAELALKYHGLLEPEQQTTVNVYNAGTIAFLQENREFIKALGDEIASRMLDKPRESEVIEGQIDGE